MTMSGNDNMFQDVFKIKMFESVFNLLIKVKVKVSHSLIAVGAVGVRVPLYLGYS